MKKRVSSQIRKRKFSKKKSIVALFGLVVIVVSLYYGFVRKEVSIVEQPDGSYKIYENGQLIHDEQADGSFKMYYPNGQLQQDCGVIDWTDVIGKQDCLAYDQEGNVVDSFDIQWKRMD